MKRLAFALLTLAAACEDAPGQFAEVPVADAGSDQTVSVGATVLLDGTGSTSSSGGELRYLWSQTAGPDVVLEGGASSQARFQAVSEGELRFELLVRTPQGTTATDALLVTVTPAEALIADAGEDQFVRPGARFTLDGSASQASRGAIVSWAWRQVGGPRIQLSGDDGPQATAMAPAVASLLVFELVVRNDNGMEARAQVQVTVSNNLPPVADAGPDRSFIGDGVVLDGQASFDPDGQLVAFEWEVVDGPPLAISDADQAVARLPNPGRVVTVELTVRDDAGATATDRARLVPAGTPPDLEVTFPPPANDFEGRVDSVFVSGRVNDPDGAAIRSVVVAGVEAELDGAQWTARMPLGFGETEVLVSAIDEAMERSERSLVIQNQPVFSSPIDFALAPDESRALVLDEDSGLVEVDLDTGQRQLLFGPSNESFSEPNGLAVDWADGIAYVTDTGRQAVGEVDLETGETRLIATNELGSGPALLANVAAPLWDEAGDRLLLLGAFPRAVLELDAATGNRTVLSGNDRIGEGPNIGGLSLDMTLDGAGNRLFVSSLQILYEIDLSTGDREALIFNSPSNRRYHSTEWDAAEGQLLLANERLESYDPDTQAFSNLSTASPDFVAGLQLRADGSGVLSVGADQILGSDITTGLSRHDVFVPRIEVGSGPDFSGASQAVFLTDLRKLFFTESDTTEFIEVDVDTGNRRLLEPSTRVEFMTGAGEQLIGIGGRGVPGFYAIDPLDGQATQLQSQQPDNLGRGDVVMTADATAAFLGPFVRRFDLTNGATTEVSGPNFGSGPAFESNEFERGPLIWRDSARERTLLVADRSALMEVDIITGARRLVTGRGRGDGPELSGVTGLVIDPEEGHIAYVADSFRGLYRVDLQTGDRRIMSGPPQSSVVQLDSERRRLYLVRGTILESSGVITVDLISGQWVVSSK